MKTLQSTAEFLDRLADRLDGWAEVSRAGGWSTHQVEANRAAANECRRESSRLRAWIREKEAREGRGA